MNLDLNLNLNLQCVYFPKCYDFLAKKKTLRNLIFLFRSSDELVFANFADPLYLKKNDRLRFWYGEDLTDNGEDDNQGNVCFDVYALFI